MDRSDEAIRLVSECEPGEVIQVHGLDVALPNSQKSDILFHDLPKKMQMWRRTDVPRTVEG